MTEKTDMENRKRILDIFWVFFKFSCVTFGGGWSLVAQMQKEYVEKKHWITNEQLLDFSSVGRSIPGLMIGNASVLFGYHVAGFPGALAALAGIVLPPFLIMLGLTHLYILVRDTPYVARAMVGVRAAVAPIIFCSVLKLFKAGMKDAFCYGVALAALALCLIGGVSNVFIVLMGALAGYLYMEGKARHDLS